MIGQTISHYKIEEKLGEGGMGVVYRARDTHLDRPVAIKVLAAEAVSNPERKKRFVQEAKSASALNHPNIITIYDIDNANGVDFIAMEYIAGRTLDQAMGRKGLRLGETLKYAVQIADALAKAHAAGIVHRDIKPANIMVTAEGHVKVLDFGLAKLTERAEGEAYEATISDAAPRTEEGAIVGTVAYMSPEQAEGKKVDERSDIFSFGSVLYEMTTGRRAFQGETKMSTLSAILSKDPKPLSETAEATPRDLERIITRCLRKDPGRRFQDMADVKIALEELKEESDSGKLAAAAAPRARVSLSARLAAIVIAIALVAIAGAWWLLRSRAPAPAKAVGLTRLTSDPGLTTDPVLSPDGKLLAYASDRGAAFGPDGNLDIYVQQLGGGAPIRLTHESVDASEPAFSPDGTRIAFRSDREGGGSYIVPALGGEPRLLVKNGRRPRFSPDGSQIAYWVGEQILLTGKIFVAPVSGGSPRQLQPDFFAANYPVWMPDGRHILFVGERNQERDWWVTSVDGGEPVKTGAFEAFRRQGFTGFPPPIPAAWAAEPDRVTFSAALGDSTNLWQIPISPATFHVAGLPQRLTFGTALETQPSGAAGRLVFSSQASSFDIWSLPVDPNRGKARGEPQRLTQDAAVNTWPSASDDGKRVVFLSNQSGNADVWLKDLTTGKETALTSTPTDEAYPKITSDGSKMAYLGREGQKSAIFLMKLGPGGRPGVAEKLCEQCGAPYDWSPDGTKILCAFYVSGGPGHPGVIDVSTGERTIVADHPRDQLLGMRFSPDGQWISFVRTPAPTRRQIFIVPYRIKTTVPESAWIPITDGTGLEREPRWSPDGKLLYFFSEQDGFRCFWAQPLDAAAKRPVGERFPVQHFHRARFSIRTQNTGVIGFVVTADKIVFSMSETTGNIWMVK